MMFYKYTAVFFLFNLSYRGESTNECSVYIDKMVDCFDNMFYTTAFCNLREEVQNCSNSIMGMMQSSNCTDKIGRKMSETHAIVIHNLLSFLCEEDESQLIPKVLMITSTVVAPYWMAFAPSFLSPRGCKFFEIFLPVELQRYVTRWYLTPKKTNFELIDVVYNVSSCKQKHVTPNYPLIINLYTVLREVDLCLIKFKKFSECDSTKKTGSQYFKCVEKATVNKIKDPKLRFVENNTATIAKIMEEIVCQNETIKEAIELYKRCVDDFISTNRYFYVQINGIYTVDGCYGLKYQKIDWMNQRQYYSASCPVTRDYWNAMKDRVKCIGTNLSETKSEMIELCRTSSDEDTKKECEKYKYSVNKHDEL